MIASQLRCTSKSVERLTQIHIHLDKQNVCRPSLTHYAGKSKSFIQVETRRISHSEAVRSHLNHDEWGGSFEGVSGVSWSAVDALSSRSAYMRDCDMEARSIWDILQSPRQFSRRGGREAVACPRVEMGASQADRHSSL